MTLRLSDFSIAQKIALACVVPLLGLAVFAGMAVFEARAKTAAAGDSLPRGRFGLNLPVIPLHNYVDYVHVTVYK